MRRRNQPYTWRDGEKNRASGRKKARRNPDALTLLEGVGRGPETQGVDEVKEGEDSHEDGGEQGKPEPGEDEHRV